MKFLRLKSWWLLGITILVLLLIIFIFFFKKPIFSKDLINLSSKPLKYRYLNLNEMYKQYSDTARVNLKSIYKAGPLPDGIPAIYKPEFTSLEMTSYGPDDLIVGIYEDGIAKAYPYKILNWHDLINDKINDIPILITLSPLCDTTPAFIRKVNGKETTFGVTGLLYQSCTVFYDNLTNSIWSQPVGVSILGKAANSRLTQIKSYKTTLGNWAKKHPNTLVLSDNTGYDRDYNKNPYFKYVNSFILSYPIRNLDKLAVPSKAPISYIYLPEEKDKKVENDNKNKNVENLKKEVFSGSSYHISYKEIQNLKTTDILLNNKKISVVWDDELQAVRFYYSDTEIPSSSGFGFVYPAFFLES